MAATSTVRIGEDAHELVRSLARETGESVRAIVERAVNAYHGHWIIEQSNQAFDRMQAEDSEAWAGHQAETATFQDANMDGLADEPAYPVREVSRRRSPESSGEEG